MKLPGTCLGHGFRTHSYKELFFQILVLQVLLVAIYCGWFDALFYHTS